MKMSTRLILVACLSLPFLAACQKEDTTAVVEEAPVAKPATNDENDWAAYLTDVVRRNVGDASSIYLYTLPAADSTDYEGEYERQLDKARTDVMRGGVQGTLLAYGSPDSAKSADLAVSSFEEAQPGSMNGVRVLFIGDAADSERVKEAVEPSGAAYQFVEAK
ncbi:hypothetical protein [Marilutibacter alkalisoli]|uniref:Secreted protein n=1 Tax=Marilutibacter alkalisoli TaxID=2591633 RepID=A0A514BPY9_9GAMM|nr:hypothetical protein [Lysobacter alkalisoli]QDH69462.1 hypothetical protein FKV23_04670 [Lysobacter alkalisoli]